jgi:hypothetical protein
MLIHDDVYKKIKVFKGRKPAFIAWICPKLKPAVYASTSLIFSDEEDVAEIYFLTKGKVGFVLPKFNNTCYIQVSIGQHFGIIDIVASIFAKVKGEEL